MEKDILYRPSDKRMRDFIANVINSSISPYYNPGIEKANTIMQALGRSPIPLPENKHQILHAIGELHLQGPKKGSDIWMQLSNVSRFLAKRAECVEKLLEGGHDMESEKHFQELIDHLNKQIIEILAL